MIDPELSAKLDTLEVKIDAAYKSAEKTRKYILWMVIITVVMIVLPLLVIPFLIGPMLASYSSALNF